MEILNPKDIENILALTSLQEGMLFHYLQAPQSRLYFEQLSLQISGSIDVPCFKKAWNVVVQGNEMLRTVFRWEKLEKPSQIILKEYPCRIIFHDLSIKDGSRKKNLEEIKTEDRNDGFDLTHVPFRVILCKLDKTKYEIILSNHHILYDGWSNGIILKEFFNAYYSLHQGERGEQSLKLPAKSSFKEFIRWLQSRDKNKQEQYWRNYLAGFETTTGLPIKKRITETTTVEDYSITLEEDIKSKLDVFIKNNRVTLASVFYTAWGILLQRYCGSEDVIFGTTVSGRSGGIKGIENMVGLFINTIPLRTQTTPNEKIIDVVFEIDHVLREREEFENTPLPDIRDCSYMGRSGSLFDTIVAIENYPLDSRLLPEGNLLAVKSYSIAEMTHYDLTVIIMPFNKIEIKFYFKQELFEKNTFENFARHFKEIIQIIIEKPGIALPKLEILAKEEINQLLYEFNDTKTGYPDDKTLYELFEEQVMKTPGSVAVVFEDQALSYGGLNEKANQLAGYLNAEINIQPGEPVAVLMDRSINIVTAILGVLEAGGAYVPIDASLPEFRIKHMIDDAGIRVVISGKSQIKILNRLQWECKNFHTFMCLDSASVYEEEEAEKNESMNEGIWKYIGESAADDITVGGWISSYTGEPFSKEEMQEYSDNTFRKLNPLLHKGMRVLEIGCSSGITMFRIAPYAGFYYGTDLSSVIIEKNKYRAKAEGYKNITLDCLPAHDMDTIADENFDLIIINSVVQYFYGHNYLRKVIVKAIAKLALKGYLFLGDIMDQERKKNLIREIGEFKRANNDKNYRTKTDWNAELFVARGFFEDLALQFPEIQNIEFSDKIYTIENELTKFRYDTLITVDKSKYKHNENKAALRQKCQHDLTTLNTFSSQRGIYQKKQAAQPKGTAYVIYTSGTSGLPKGIMIEHRSVINFIKGMTAVIDFRKDDRILSLTTISFDIFGLEVLLPLTRGSEVVIGNREEQSDPGAMSRILVKKTISILQLTPSRLQVLLSGEIHKALFKGLKYLIIGGETFPGTLLNEARRLMPGEIYNVYGPTETTIWSTIKNVSGGRALNIGRPMANTQVYIVDKNKNLVPVIVPGELYIGGDGVARGYLNNPELTMEKFDRDLWDKLDKRGGTPRENFHHSASGIHHSILYRTGDLARWLPDGNIEFLGRIDHQVKVRGFRIELAEIENRLSNHPGINEAVVSVQEEDSGDNYLCAYIVSDREYGIPELQEFLSRELPDYMIPSYFVRFEKIPLTPNGKIDRKTLPNPELRVDESYTAPRDEIEKKLAELWSDILARDPLHKSQLQASIGIDDNFFQVGGHSLKATALLSKIHKAFEVKIPLSEIFKNPRIRLLSKYIKDGLPSKYEQINGAEKKEYYVLSSMQKRLYFLQQMDTVGTAYNISAAWIMEGIIDKPLLEQSIRGLIQGHESLRTSIRVIEEEPVQRIHDEVAFEIEYKDLTTNKHGQTRTYLNNFFRAFALSKAPLLRVGLVKLEEEKHMFLVDMHHLISDGMSTQVLIHDFSTLYSGKKLPEIKLQYKDYAEWQNRERVGKNIMEQAEYWKKEYEGEIPVLELPVDYARPAVRGFEGNSIDFEIDVKTAGTLKALALKAGTTLYIVLLALYTILLAKLSGQEDIIIGSPIAGRRQADLEKIIGMFVNTLALRNYPSGEKKFIDFLEEVKRKTVKAFENQEYEYEYLVEKVAVKRAESRNPLFDTMFALQNTGSQELKITGLHIVPLAYENQTSIFDLILNVVEIEEKLQSTFAYSTKLFKQETVERFSVYFKNLIRIIIENKNSEISELEILTVEEKNRILFKFNDTGSEYPKNKTMQRLFQDQVERRPDKIALVGAAERDKACVIMHLSYREANEKSEKLAGVLRKKGVGPDTIVGIMMERSIEIIINIIAILKSGGAYLPIDPEYPQARIDYMLADSDAKILIDKSEIRIFKTETNFHASNLSSSNLAYIIYTSGSTGRPKGVMVEHRSVLRLVLNSNYIHFQPHDRLLLTGAMAFDITTFEIWAPLLNGFALVMAGKEIILHAEKLKKRLQQQNISILHLIPSLFNQLAAQDIRLFAPLSYFLVGGDTVHTSQINRLREQYPRLKILHMYGPTENTTFSTFFPIEQVYAAILPIGKPISNANIYILNKYHSLQPPGVAGELCVGGAGLARGYLNAPELTAQRFIHPGHIPAFIYKTGDLGRWMADGNIQFLGRIDYQVKIRGFRIELGEIENRLKQYEGITGAAVTVKEDRNGEKYLCAFIVAIKEPSPPELKKYLLQYLPGYMVPAYFIPLTKIPLTPHGKVDARELPDPHMVVGAQHIAPRNANEEKLVEIWSDVLGIEKEKIGIHDHFFDLGGSSIKMIRLNSKLEKLFNKEIPVVTLFRYTTISTLAEYLSEDNVPHNDLLHTEKQAKNSRQENLEKSNETGSEIAVIGMAGRFSGARNIAEFWHNLKNGVESISFYTEEELIAAGVNPMLPANPSYVRTGGGLLIDPDCFDSTFFGYIPSEAEILDPQVRIYHECSWEALEDAGYAPGLYDGRIGIYAGASNNPAWEASVMLSEKNKTMGEINAMILCNKEFLCSWISYKLNLKGPAIEVHTACSTSLVAIHMACRSLLANECDMALAGGVYIRSLEKTGYLYQEGLILSADGHCRAFDAAATGTIGGSGAGAVVLKKLNRAIDDHDHIYAIVKGTAINNDGPRKVGFTAPSIEGQADVIKTALHLAQVQPESIAYIETHGTGTIIGDPIEIAALTLAFNTPKKGFCAIGSVKTNIGHADSAAGVAGFIKAVLSLKYKLIPPSLNFNTPNPNIDFEHSPFFVNRIPASLENVPYPVRMGVSSFGIGGTNAHVVLEEAPPDTPALRENSKYRLLLLSAKTPAVLQRMTGNFLDHLNQNPGIKIDDAAFTLQMGRQAFSHRNMVVCADTPGAIAALNTLTNNQSPLSHVKEGKKSIIFMFPGIGSQYVNMGLGLYRTYPLFQAEMDRCFAILKSILPYDIKDILYPSTNLPGPDVVPAISIDHVQVSQLSIFILEYALSRLIMSWGITPRAMTGYSLGEYTAACLAGVFSLEDALQIIALRGRLIDRLPTGTMLSVPMTAAKLTPLLEDPVTIAIDNGPSCIITGPDGLLEKFQNRLKEERHLCLKLKNSHAVHSRMMAPIAREFAEYLGTVKWHTPQIPYISNVSGSWITVQDATDPLYWVRHLQETVRFADGMERLKTESQPIFIEIGPGRDLSALCVRFQEDNPDSFAVNLIRPQAQDAADDYYLMKKIGHLWLRGVPIAWHGFYAGRKNKRVSLPTYPFAHERYPLLGDPYKIANAIRETDSPSLQKRHNITQWFYHPAWEKSFFLSPQPLDNLEKTDWLVFIDKNDVGRPLITQLQQSGGNVFVVTAGKNFQRVSDREFTVNPGLDGDYEHLFADLLKNRRMPRQILHLWGIGEPIPGHQRLQESDALQDLGFFSLLGIARAIGSLGIMETIYIAAITDNMQDVTGTETLCPLKSPILGAVNVIPLEYKNIRCCSIDIQIPETGHWLDKITQRLRAEITHHFPDHIVAYRGNHRWVRVIKPIPFPDYGGASPLLKEKGVYMITGGLSGIGWALAEYLGRSLQSRLILVARSPFPARGAWESWLAGHPDEDPICLKIRSFIEIEKSGGQVCVFQGDVADPIRMAEIISQSRTRFQHINGVIHSAGIPDGGLIQVRSREMSQKVFSSKLTGTLILEELFKDEPLDFFVMCSSLASILGPGGQVAYSAANAFLDAHALYKTANDDRRLTVSINWDTWQETGMAIQVAAKITSAHQSNAAEAIRQLLGHGLLNAEGVEVFRRIIGRRYPQVMVSTKDFAAVAASAQTFYENLNHSGTLENMEAKKSRGPLRPRPDISSVYLEPRTEIEQKLVCLWQTFFGFQTIGIDDDLFELGGDSLKATAIIAGIHRDCGVKVPLSEIFNHPTIRGAAEYIRGTLKSSYTGIEPVEEREYYPLSSAQRRLYILYLLEENSTAYNMSLLLSLEQDIDIESMEKTFKALISRHESLRTSFHKLGAEFVQRIQPTAAFTMEYYPLDNSCESPADLMKDFIRPFDLSRAPVIRARLCRQEEKKYILMVDMHHIVSDGVSNSLFLQDFVHLYAGLELLPLKLRYRDYCQWLHKPGQMERVALQEAFWLKELQGNLPLLNLPTDFPRGVLLNFEGQRLSFEIPPAYTGKLKEMARREGTSLYTILLTIFNILLSKLCSQAEIVIGVDTAGRTHADFQQIIGVFVNTLVLRTFPGHGKTFQHFLQEVKAKTLVIFENQDYPFDLLADKLVKTRIPSRNPLFDVLFSFEHFEMKALEIPEALGQLVLKPYPLENFMAKLDINLKARVSDNIEIIFEYKTRLFKKSTIQRYAGYFQEIAAAVSQHPGILLEDIKIAHDLVEIKQDISRLDLDF